MNGIDAVFQKLLSGHQILITDGRSHAQTVVKLNAPPPFFKWRGDKNVQTAHTIGVSERHLKQNNNLIYGN